MGATRYDLKNYGEYRRYLSDLGDDNTYEYSLLKRRLAKAMVEELTARQRQMTLMYFSEGLSMTEIAAELGVNVSTVSRTLKRARGRLHRCLRFGARELLDTTR